MNIDWVGDPEIPYESRLCPECKAINWAVGVDPDNNKNQIDAIECWRCEKVFWLNGYFDLPEQQDLNNAVVCAGEPDPVIPIDVLENLVDSAHETMVVLEKSITGNAQVALMDEIRDSINHVKNLLFESNVQKTRYSKKNSLHVAYTKAKNSPQKKIDFSI